MKKKINIHDEIFKSGGGDGNKVISNNLYGLSLDKGTGALPSSTDKQGFVFFTRPQLNLTDKNIMNIRRFYPLLNKDLASPQRYVRNMLDPRLGLDIKNLSPLVNNKLAFIPILSNSITSLSGWPDMVVPTKTTSAGLRKESISMIDGAFEIYDSFDLSATFNNFIGEPLTWLFNVWMMYPSYVFEGMMYPYNDFIIENEFDYNTRIYRFVMDKSNRFIKKAACTGASFPTNSPTGKFFDLNMDTPYSDQTKTINTTFKSMGAMYYDDIILDEFNKTSAIFHAGIRKYLEDPEGDHGMVVIPNELLSHFKYRAYPIIDLDTYELKWLIENYSPTLKRIVDKGEKDGQK